MYNDEACTQNIVIKKKKKTAQQKNDNQSNFFFFKSKGNFGIVDNNYIKLNDALGCNFFILMRRRR